MEKLLIFILVLLNSFLGALAAHIFFYAVFGSVL